MTAPLQSQANYPTFATSADLAAYSQDGLLNGFLAATYAPFSVWMFSTDVPTSGQQYIAGVRGYWVRYADLARDVPYDDSVTPHTGSTNVQGAIDALKAAGGGTVTSVFGRTGAVVAAGGDYTAGQVGADPAGTSAALAATIAAEIGAPGGIAPLNGASIVPTANLPVFVASVSGTAPIASSGGTTPAISITAATTSNAGSLSAADKTKLDTVTSGAAVASVAATAPITSTGGTTPTIAINAATTSLPGSLSAADKTKLDSVTSGAAVASITGTAPIVSSGGTTPAISISAATTGAAGSIKLAGDLGGTGAVPTVISVTGAGGTLALAATAAIVLFAAATSAPTITQSDNTTNSATAQTMSVLAQNATGTTSVGGTLALLSGTGTTSSGGIQIGTRGANPFATSIGTGAAILGQKLLRIAARNNGNTADVCAFEFGAANQLYIGATLGATLAVASINIGGSAVNGIIMIGGGSGSTFVCDGNTHTFRTAAGAAGICILSAASFLWDKAASAPIFGQTTPTTDITPQAVAYRGQAPFATATGANRVPGNAVLESMTPTNSGTTYGSAILRASGSDIVLASKDASGNATIRINVATAATATAGAIALPTFLSGFLPFIDSGGTTRKLLYADA